MEKVVTMGLNFYLRRTRPIEVTPEFHIGKRSYGWLPSFEANDSDRDFWPVECDRPVVNSVDDISRYVESGDWEIVDEEDRGYTFAEFIHYIDDDFPSETENGIERRGHGIDHYKDPTGHEFYRGDFC